MFRVSRCKDTTFPRYYRRIPQKISVCLSMSKIAQAECKAKARFLALLRRSRFSSEAQRSILVFFRLLVFLSSRLLHLIIYSGTASRSAGSDISRLHRQSRRGPAQMRSPSRISGILLSSYSCLLVFLYSRLLNYSPVPPASPPSTRGRR